MFLLPLPTGQLDPLLDPRRDGGIGAADSMEVYQQFANDFKYPLSDIGPLEYVLKINVRHVGSLLYLSQVPYINELATKFGVLDANPKYTPMVVGAVLRHSGGCA